MQSELTNERWNSERSFFDAELYKVQAFPTPVVERYQKCSCPWLSAEFPYHVMGDVRGKRILEIGCGDGANAVMLALKGASVVGVDISPNAIEAAKSRAALNGVSATTKFFAVPLEEFSPPDGVRFDIIAGISILHHLLPVLDSVLTTMKKDMATPETLFLFSEPVIVWPWLRRFRLLLPIAVNVGTPGECPLDPSDMAIVRKHFPNLKVHYFDGTMRIVNKYFLRGVWYENLSPFLRRMYSFVSHTDEFALNNLGLEGLAGEAVMYGTYGHGKTNA